MIPETIHTEATTVDALTDHGTRIARAAIRAGMFNVGHLPTPTDKSLRQEARQWLHGTSALLPRLTAAEILPLITVYDLVHRVAFRCPADTVMINRHVFRAFDALVHGDSAVDQYDMYRAIKAGLDRRDSAYFDRTMQWNTITLGRWHRQFRRGTPDAPLSDYDTLNRVAILLSDDLWAYEASNQAAFKHRLFMAHRHYLDAPEVLDQRTLRALDHFLTASRPFLTEADHT
ncbi:MAG: hypothetical protein K2M19_00820, partial [Muribaculaceae bacterium]|nr:hypothetical protein [Muribaculaceae bacterium]